jgi:hypothetical protein
MTPIKSLALAWTALIVVGFMGAATGLLAS